jgi:alpha-glucosidase (family GH31 glycosyl hydrolase)
MTTKGYGVLRNTIANGRYDFTSNSVVDTYHLDKRFDAYYFYGPSFGHILDGFTDLTGRPRMLPRWAIGLGDASAYRQLNDTMDQGGNPSNMQNVGSEASGNYQPQQTPFGGFWRDRGTVGIVDDYIEQYLNKDMPVSWFLPNDGYRCEYNKYTHPAGGLDVLGKELRNYGIRFGLWIGQPSNYTEANYTYGYPASVTGNDRAPYFTRELEAQARSGARVYKVDVAWSSGKSGNKGPMAVYRYLLDNIETNSKTAENPDGERGFIIGVYGWTGVQRYATVWSGDQMGTYDYTSYHVPTFAGSGMSGFPFSFNDAGSIYNDYPGVYVRDLQMKTLMPINYAMSNWGNRVTYAQIDAAWEAAGNRQDAGPNNTDEFPPNSEQRVTSDKRPGSEYHFTDGELDINHKYLMLKQQMVPYIYSYIRNSSLTGAPLVRPMVYNFQDDPYTYGEETKYQYMSGDWMLAAPVINAIDTVRDNIYLPAGRWIDYWTGESYFGPTTITVNAPYDTMPMFARAGAIVPMSQEFLYDGQEFYTNKAGKTIEVKDTLLIDLYPEGKTTFDLYEDDGYTLKFETKDEYTYTTITSDAPAIGTGPLTVAIGPAIGKAFEGQVAERKNLLMVHTQTKPGAVKLGGADGTVLPMYNSKYTQALTGLHGRRGYPRYYYRTGGTGHFPATAAG